MRETLARLFSTGVASLMVVRNHSEGEAVELIREVQVVEFDPASFGLVHNESGLVAMFNPVEIGELQIEGSRAQERLYLCACALVGAYEINGCRYAEQVDPESTTLDRLQEFNQQAQ